MSEKFGLTAGEYALLREEELRGAISRAPGFRAFERGATVLALGALTWGGFYLYELFSGWAERVEETVNDVAGYVTPVDAVVNPAAVSEEAIQAALKEWRPSNWFHSRKAYELALRETASKVSEEGAGKLTTVQKDLLKRSEAAAVKEGLISRAEAVGTHPVDRVAGFVLRDKNYWGIVLGITVLPAVPVAISIMRDVRRETG